MLDSNPVYNILKVKFVPLPAEYYQALPKVDLHRHLEGSVRVKTMSDIGRRYGLDVPGTGQLRGLTQVVEDDPYTFENFLSKFKTLRLFFRSPEVIDRITREAVQDAAADGVRYLELRFTPMALSCGGAFALSEVMDWVITSSQQAAQEAGIAVGLIASVNRHESVQIAEQVAGLAAERRERGILGVDLAGNEAQFPAAPFTPIFRAAQDCGLRLTVHAGEWGGAENVAYAIEEMGADRIGHGIRVMEDPRAVALARERGTTFDVCLTSNVQSGAVPSLAEHPLRQMLENGLSVSLGTDDPSICRITLSDEFRRAREGLGVPEDNLRQLIQTGAQASFLPVAEKAALLAALAGDLPG